MKNQGGGGCAEARRLGFPTCCMNREIGLFTLAIVWTTVALIMAIQSKFSPQDVAAVCKTHRGVAQVESRWTGKDKAIVVCRDGSVQGVR